nr:thiol reductant ABC exporter subunit CydC [Micromonospora sp. DSM 115978]
MLRYYRPAWPRLALGVVAGAGATCAGTALTAASAWLICRAWQQPPVLALLVAVVGVRAFGLSRPVLRYVERLLTHDAALRVLAELRTGVFARLLPLAPAHLAATRRGEVLRQFTHDVDD